MNLKLEVVIIPVSDVDRAKAFYETLGFRLDIDFAPDEMFRVVQFTPPASEASIIFGKGITAAAAGSADTFVLAVEDVDAAREELHGRGIKVSEVFHYAHGPFSDELKNSRVRGRDPEGRSYFSFASFEDPDGNRWILQEIKARLPGRRASQFLDAEVKAILESALKVAEAAHGTYEKSLGMRDNDWPKWYADHITKAWKAEGYRLTHDAGGAESKHPE